GVGEQRRELLLLDVLAEQALEGRPPRSQGGENLVARLRAVTIAVEGMEMVLEAALADSRGSHPLEEARMALEKDSSQTSHEEVGMHGVRNAAPAPVDLGVRGG